MRYLACALLIAACDPPPRDPSTIYPRVAKECAPTYVAPADGADVTLSVRDELTSTFDLRAMCFEVDGANAILLDGVAGKSAERHIVIGAGTHKITAQGVWTSGGQRNYNTFVVKSSHDVEGGQPHRVSLTFFEQSDDGPIQDRPRAAWRD